MVSTFPAKKNTAFKAVFPILDADGDLVTAAGGLDSNVSIDGGTFAACTNEATEIATSSGMYYLNLTAAEMNGDVIAVIVKTSTSGAKTTALVFYTAAQTLDETDAVVDAIKTETDSHPTLAEIEATTVLAKEATLTAIKGTGFDTATDSLVKIHDDHVTHLTAAPALASVCTEARLAELNAANLPTDVDAIKDNLIAVTGTADSGTTTTLVDAARTEADDFWNDMLLVIIAGTNVGQARRISDFVAATDTITVDAAFNAAIDNTSEYSIILDRQAAGGGGDATLANQTAIMGTGFDTATDSLVKLHDDHLTHITAAPSTHAAADVWTVGTRALTDKAGFSLSAAGIDSIIDEVVEGTLTLRQAVRLFLSALAGKSAGGGTTTITFRDKADSKNRISATVDADGNRTAITLDGS